MNADQTPAPSEIKVSLDEVTLTVPDISKPLWFGNYYSGKLAIYAADVEIHSDASEECIRYMSNAHVYICTLTETGKADFMIYSPYEASVSVTDVCDHLLNSVWTAYQGQLQVLDPAAYLPASTTVQ